MKMLILLLGISFISLQADQKVASLPDSVNKKIVSMNKNYLVFTPRKKSSMKKMPLMIFLHGMGERGTNIEKIKVHGPPKVALNNKNFEFLVISPQCLKDTSKGKGKGWWNTNDLELLLEHVKKTYPVDEKRIYLTGLSMGGFGSWAWAASKPDHFAAVAPICGGGNPKMAKKYNMPVWAFHGDKDNVVKLNKSKDMVEAIKKVNGDAKLTVYKGVGHNSWTKAYNDPELYKWFLSHTK